VLVLPASPQGVTATRGRPTDYFVSYERRGNVQGPVQVRLLELPTGVTATPLEGVTGERVGVRVEAGPEARPGESTVRLELTGGELTQTASVALTVRDPGGLSDTSYGTAGAITVPSLPGMVAACGVIVDAQGASHGLQRHDKDYVLQKRDAQGELVREFGTQGELRLGFGTELYVASCAVARAHDGAILMGGTRGYSPTAEAFVARVRADGSLDPAFGSAGIAWLKVDTSSTGSDLLHGMTVLADGRIAVAGTRGFDAFVARLQPDGTPDVSFARNGVWRRSPAPVDDGYAYPGGLAPIRVAVGLDGHLLVAVHWTVWGNTGGERGGPSELMRLKPDGTLDTSFGSAGVVTLSPYGATNPGLATALAVRPDGRILVGYTDWVEQIERGQVLQFLPSGAPDPAFGAQGRLMLPAAVFASDVGMRVTHSLHVLADGKVLLGANAATVIGTSGLGLLRLTPSGGIDPGFGAGKPLYLSQRVRQSRLGLYLASFGGMAELPDGRWLLHGDIDELDRGLLLARIWP
jgi:uncharacterized delta-60 repeat protein